MALKAPVRENVDFEKLQPGTYQAVISQVYDIGLQPSKNLQTGITENKHQCIVLFEVNERFQTGKFAGERFVQSRTYNFTMSRNAGLRKLVEIVTGTLTDEEAGQFDLETLRGCNVSLTIEQKGEYLNISGIGGLIKGMQEIQPELHEGYRPEWISKKIANQAAPDATSTHGKAVQDDLLGDIHENDLIETEINQLIEAGKISKGDKNATIQRVLGRPGTLKDCTPDQAATIADRLVKFAQMKSVKPGV